MKYLAKACAAADCTSVLKAVYRSSSRRPSGVSTLPPPLLSLPLPPCPLTEVEAKELTAWLDAEYRKQGQELGQEQAAMMAGALAGYAAATKGPQKVGKNRTNAGSVPEFDISAYCKSVAMGSPLIESGCFDAEREARTAIAAMTDLPENVLRHCTDVAQTGRGSYTVMQSCINKEMNAKKQTGP